MSGPAPVEVKQGDPFGRDRESPIPPPVARTGERVPPPTFELGPGRDIPFLKPIRVNTRNVEQVLRGFIAKEEPQIVRFLVSTWNAQAEDIKFEEIRNALVNGEINERWLKRWREDYVKIVNEKLDPRWRKGFSSGASFISSEAEKSLGFSLSFRDSTINIRDWIDTRGAEFVTNMTTFQRDAVRNAIRHFTVEDPVGPRELGRMLRAQIGHTAKQGRAVINFRIKIKKLVAEGKLVLTNEQILRRVDRFSGRLLRLRAERIARTEMAFAMNFGMHEQINQAVEAGDIGPVVKLFQTAEDELVCPFCAPLNQKVIGFEETFPGATVRVPNVITPPVHPNCRCTVIYITDADDLPAGARSAALS